MSARKKRKDLFLRKLKHFRKLKNIFEKKLSLLAGKMSLGKKACAFEMCLVLIRKYTKSFCEKNPALCSYFFPSKVLFYHKLQFKSVEIVRKISKNTFKRTLDSSRAVGLDKVSSFSSSFLYDDQSLPSCMRSSVEMNCL